MGSRAEIVELTEQVGKLKAQVEQAQETIRELLGQADAAREEARHLREALVTAREIGAAVGVVMATYRLAPDEAFTVLRRASQTSHRKLREIAEEVLLTGAVPETVPATGDPDVGPGPAAGCPS